MFVTSKDMDDVSGYIVFKNEWHALQVPVSQPATVTVGFFSSRQRRSSEHLKVKGNPMYELPTHFYRSDHPIFIR